MFNILLQSIKREGQSSPRSSVGRRWFFSGVIPSLGKPKINYYSRPNIKRYDEFDEDETQQSQTPLPHSKSLPTCSHTEPTIKLESDPNNEDKESVYPQTEKVYQTFDCNGVNVKFPYTPYPSQMALMNKLILAAKNKDSALLESPTGTGKTLALLCSSLAWLQDFKADRRAKTDESRVESDTRPTPASIAGMKDAIASLDPAEFYGWKEKQEFQGKRPVIYYGTRTHKQIQQVVEELRTKTPYTPKITILGSRQQYCIHPEVIKQANREDACNKLRDQTRKSGARKMEKVMEKMRNALALSAAKSSQCATKPPDTCAVKKQSCKKKKIKVDSESCVYSVGTSTMFHKMNDVEFLSKLRQDGGKMEDVGSPVWDSEDLVLAGKKAVGCPYYAARELALSADIVFCPYNYLLYPSIRRAMQISLNGNIFIIDEAHNIEATARDAASFDLPTNILDQLGYELQVLAFNPKIKFYADKIFALVAALRKFSENKVGYYLAQEDQDSEQCVWKVDQFWRNLRFSHSDLPDIGGCLEALREYKKLPNNEKDDYPALTDLAEQSLDSLFAVLNFMLNFEDAYKVVVETMYRSFTLSFWCLDSGIIFSDFSRKARSVILTSGTLAPLGTFSSELATKFGLLHEGEHVIEKDQVWAGAVSLGPKDTVLNGIYQTAQTQAYQDDIGAALIDIAKTVPGGILCFLPSYSLLSNLMARWKATGDFDQLEGFKKVFVEPRMTGKAFDSALKRYRDLCKDPGLSGITGPIMFAVFRGKLSEGIDFRDAECRCVVSIGIPYPSFSDLKVVLKRDFNNRNQHSRQLISGSSWYEAQAYRAVNQALGRCIRHKDDWGSVVFLEHRFTMPQRHQSLPKWVKSSLVASSTYQDTIDSLSSFVATRSPSTVLQKDDPDLIRHESSSDFCSESQSFGSSPFKKIY